MGVRGRAGLPASRARMARVAVRPSITGICMSISTMSNRPRLEGRQGLGAVVDGDHLGPVRAQDQLDDALVGGMVLGQQDAQGGQAGQPRPRAGEARPVRIVASLQARTQRQLDHEPAADTGGGGRRDAPAHQLDQGRQIDRPRPVPPKRRVMRGVGLAEAVEQAWRHDPASKPTPVSSTSSVSMSRGRPSSSGHAEADGDRARRGELDGVGQQIAQHLADAGAVADEDAARLGRALDDGRPAPCPRPAAASRSRRAAMASSRSNGAGLDVQLSGLDLGDVQDVGDQPFQRHARRSRISADHLGLFRAEARCATGRRRCRSRRSAACGSRGSYWPGSRTWRGWRPRRRPWPRPGPARRRPAR